MDSVVAALGTPGARFEMTVDEQDQSPDGRILDPGSVNFDRPPPLPAMLMTIEAEGHDGAQLCGIIDSMERQGNTIVLQGNFDAGSEAGVEAERLVRDGVLTTWSPTFSDVTSELEITAMSPEGVPTDAVEHLKKATILGGTLVPMPAFGSAKVRLMDSMPAMTQAPSVQVLPGTGSTGYASTSATIAVGNATTVAYTFAVSDKAWDASSSRFTDEQYKRAAAGCRGESDAPKTDCFLVHHEPDGAVNRNGVHAAAERFNQTQAPSSAKNGARGHLAGHYRNDLKEDVPDALAASAAPCQTCSQDALAAAAAPVHPPIEWFDEPELDEMTPIIVTEEGQVFGLLAGADCHIGIQNKCVTVAQTSRDFGWFNHGLLKTSEGKDVAVGQLTLAGGHAALELDARSAAAHYDDTRSAVADVQVGWSEKFQVPWFAGALKPGVSEEDVRTLRASGVSGDWRNIRGELQLVAALVVPVPGFPIYRSRVASGEPEALIVASGALSMAPIDVLRRELAALRARVDRVENVTKPLVPLAGERLVASLAPAITVNTAVNDPEKQAEAVAEHLNGKVIR